MELQITTDPAVEVVFNNYPPTIREKMTYLRSLVHSVADQMDEVESLEETLKWGEPSFVTKHGSTLRMDWKEKTPDQYAMYFQCSSRLVDTFRLIHGDTFKYEGNRALVFPINQSIPESALRECIKATLRYHKVKKLVSLGIGEE